MVKKSSLMENNRVFILLFLFCALNSFSCGNNHSKKHKDIDKTLIIKEQGTTVKDSVRQESHFKPDSTINNILILNNSESSKQFYSGISSEKLIERLRESPVLALSNEAKEYLLLYQYEGGVKDEFNCFEIGYVTDLEIETISVDYKNFETESGLKLGLSLKELVKIKGKSYAKKGCKIIYRLDDYLNSSFLKKYNMPAYFLECTIKNDRINRIKLGFDYP